jgi:hypothetical protein
MLAFLDNGHPYVNRDRDPDLGQSGVVRGAVESLDVKILFDLFEGQFHLPVLAVKPCDCERVECEVVRNETEIFPGFRINIPYPAQMRRVGLAGFDPLIPPTDRTAGWLFKSTGHE